MKEAKNKKQLVIREKRGAQEKIAGTRQKKQEQENAEKKSIWKLLIDEND